MARPVEDLINQEIPYSEMDEEEIQSVVEYKAAVLSRDTLYVMQMQEHNAMMVAAAKKFGAVADRCAAQLDQQMADANARLAEAFKLADEVKR